MDRGRWSLVLGRAPYCQLSLQALLSALIGRLIMVLDSASMDHHLGNEAEAVLPKERKTVAEVGTGAGAGCWALCPWLLPWCLRLRSQAVLFEAGGFLTVLGVTCEE